MPIITLTSDFGLKDYRVATIKGAILSLNSDAKIVDISHEIDAYNLLQTSYIIKNAYPFFPNGSVHIISVDAFYNKNRKYVLYKADGHYFIAADNGVLSLVFFDLKPQEIYEITYNNRFDDAINFPTTDVFVPSALHLLNGGLPEIIGRKYTTPKELSFPNAKVTQKMIVGEVMYIDNFGNVITNITKNTFDKILKKNQNFVIKFRSTSLTKIFSKYTDIVTNWDKEKDYHGKAVALFNDSGLLELTIYKGNKNNGANNLFGLGIGDNVFVEFQ